MRIQYTHNLSLMLEDLSRRDDSAFTKCLQVCLYQTLADRLWTPFKAVCFNPFITLLVVLVVYIVFSIIYTPLWLASLLITSYGSFILFLVFINYIANTVSRAIAFAGCNVSVQKQISSEFFRRIVAFLEMVAVQISDFTAILLLGASGQIPFHEMPPMDVKFEEIVTRAGSLPTLSGHFRESLNFLTSQLMVTPEEYTVMNQLCTTIDEQIAALSTLQPLAISYITALETSRRSNNAASRGRNGTQQGQQQAAPQQVPRGTQELFKAASQCLKISKALKIAVDSSKPPVTSEEDSGLIGKLKSVLSFNQGLEGCEKLTFPYMRCLLQQRFKVERISLVGCDKNKIDGVIFPASALLVTAPVFSAGAQAAASPLETSSMSTCGLVMFCSPNAGFYEGMSQSDMNSSWLGMYLKMGYDVCMFNYRGYGLSTGCPNPHGIKQDACQLYTHLQRTRHPKRIILHGESIGGMVACHVARHMPVDVLVCDRTFSTLDATAARLMGRWAGLGLRYCTLWSTNVVRDYLAVTCPKIVLQDPDDEIIANLASLKNGVAMRVVLGDLSWKILPEPRDYAYAHFLGEELPNKDKENTMIEEAGDVTKKLSEDFITHFYACLADIARRASAAQGKQKTRRPRAALAPVAATPRRVSHRSGHSSTGADAADKSANAGSGASSSVNSSASRRSASSSNSNSNGATETQAQSPGDDGYSSHDSRRSSKEFFNEDDVEEGADSGSDASAKGLIMDMMGIRSTSNDNWSLDQHGMETEPTTLEDVENSGAKRGTISPRPVLRQNSATGGNAAADSALRVPTSRKEWLEQFCSTQMRDPAGGPGGAGGPQSPQNNKALLAPAVSPAMKAWAAVGRIDGGSGQLLGQALSSGIEGVRAWICSLLVWSPNSTKDFSLPKGCTDIPAALDDLNILISEVHPAELQQDRAVLFLKRALLCLQRRRDAQIFHKPPLALMLRGAISFERDCVSDSSAADGMEAGEQSEVRHEPAPGSSDVTGAAAQRTHTQAGVAPDSALGVMMSKLVVQAGACLCAAKTFLSSNSYASLDMCHDLDDLHHAGPSGADCAAGNVSVNAVASSAHSVLNGCVCSTGPAHSAQLPYVGSIIALHCGHNGWPAQTELAALQSFFVKNSIVA